MTEQSVSAERGAGALTQEEAWRAVEERDGRFDGVFVYGVRTTGIYCRPSCPSRRPRREHVELIATPGEAELAGFRACLRCHPGNDRGTPAEQAVERVRARIDRDLDASDTLDELAAEAGMSPYHLLRTFRRLVGLTPKGYRDARRMEKFKGEVKKGDTVLGAAFGAGFGSSRGLYERAENGLGMTPGTYRRGGRGLGIRFTTIPSSFGEVLIAATDRGVCAVLIGDDPISLESALAGEFPQATIERSDTEMREWATEVIRFLDGRSRGFNLPLDPQGTDFQRRVWKALQQIPYGETRSYGEVAAMLGQPTATRAVAGACAHNNISLAIPCHRVLPREGGAGGYRWGSGRKQRLLEMERRNGGEGGASDGEIGAQG